MNWSPKKRLWVMVGGYLLAYALVGLYLLWQIQKTDTLIQQQQQLTQQQQQSNQDYRGSLSESRQIEEEMKQYDIKNTPLIQTDAENFLKAYYTYNNNSQTTERERLAEFTTPALQKSLSDQPPPNPKEEGQVTIRSHPSRIYVYHAPATGTQATVFARVWQKNTVGGVSTTVQLLVHLQMVYSPQQKRWLVEQIRVEDPPLQPKGFLNV